MKTEVFGVLPDGREVKAFRLGKEGVLAVTILELGCIIESVKAPDREGAAAELTLGYADLAGWFENQNYFGALIGRFGGRIGNARFELNGKTVELVANRVTDKERCHIHGGETGLTRRIWSGQACRWNGMDGVELRYSSPAGEEGYPGNLELATRYGVDEEGGLHLEMTAETDAPTPVNLANHTYWNLSGQSGQSIEGHQLSLIGDRILEIGADLIPTGHIIPVSGTPLDFRDAHRIGERIDADHPLISRAGGYDHYWIFPDSGELQRVACVEDPGSGRRMELYTDQPGVVFYTGNFLGARPGHFRDGASLGPRAGFCLETQGYPDAPNHPEFPSCILEPGTVYRHRMVWRFSAS